MKLVKKSMAILLVLAMLLSLTCAASAKGFANGTCGLHATWELSFTGTLTIDGTGDIKAYAANNSTDFRRYASRITTVSMGANITGVGAYAFQGMPTLTSVKIGENVLHIDKYAFADCPVLSSVTLGASQYSIGAYAFSNCPAIQSIIIPKAVTTLSAHAFEGCSGLQTIEIQNAACKFASADVLPQGVTVVGYKGSTAETYAKQNGLAFKALDDGSTTQPTTPTQPTSGTTTTDAGKCPLCGQTHEGFPGSLIGGVHSFIYWLLMLFGMRN